MILISYTDRVTINYRKWKPTANQLMLKRSIKSTYSTKIIIILNLIPLDANYFQSIWWQHVITVRYEKKFTLGFFNTIVYSRMFATIIFIVISYLKMMLRIQTYPIYYLESIIYRTIVNYQPFKINKSLFAQTFVQTAQ